MRKSYLTGAKITEPDYFCIESLEDGNEIYFGDNLGHNSYTSYVFNRWYSFDQRNWIAGTVEQLSPQQRIRVTLNKNEKVYFKRDTRFAFGSGYSGIREQDNFYSTKTVKVSGKLSTLFSTKETPFDCVNKYRNYSNYNNTNHFSGLFYNYIADDYYASDRKRLKIVDASELKINIYNADLASFFAEGWRGSINGSVIFIESEHFLAKAPKELTYLNNYNGLFDGCTELITLPKLLPLDTTDAKNYRYMFYKCSKIKMSITQDSTYINTYRIPYYGNGTAYEDGSAGNSSLARMFEETGGTFTGTPLVNTTYYTSNEIE